jgi:uncharacterized protein YcbK (DUF882 family)
VTPDEALRFSTEEARLSAAFNTPHGKSVLDDLAPFCRARETCVVPGDRDRPMCWRAAARCSCASGFLDLERPRTLVLYTKAPRRSDLAVEPRGCARTWLTARGRQRSAQALGRRRQPPKRPPQGMRQRARCAAARRPGTPASRPTRSASGRTRATTIDDPKALALKLTKQYRAAEKHIGAPPDRIIRLPEKPDDSPAGNGVYSASSACRPRPRNTTSRRQARRRHRCRPGARRRAARRACSPRACRRTAPDVVKAVIKSLDDAAAAEATVDRKAKIDEEKAEAQKELGPNYDFNHLKAMEGARKLGITPEASKAMEGQIGYAAVMEAMRKIGAAPARTPSSKARGPAAASDHARGRAGRRTN